MESFVVRLNQTAQRKYRDFWTGPLGSAILIAPGVIVVVVGLVFWITQGGGATNFFAAVVVFTGAYGAYAGWDHRRKAARGSEGDPLAFVVLDDGVEFPRGKKFDWNELRFVITDEVPPRLLVTPVGAAYAIGDLDREPGEIAAALAQASDGLVGLEWGS